MKRFNLLYIILMGILFFSCNNYSPNVIQNKNFPSEYPRIIDSLNLQTEYTNAKWALYLLRCDDTPKTTSDSFLFYKNPQPFSSMELILDSLLQRGDTIDLYFAYQNDEGIKVGNCTPETLNKEIVEGKRYIKNNDSTIWWLYRCTNISQSWIGPADPKKFDSVTEREIKQLQPDVIAFLNKNRKALHPWLYKEAVKRGVIKDSF